MRYTLPLLAIALLASACEISGPPENGDPPATTAADRPDRAEVCDADDGEILLPEGFCARVFAEAGSSRHIAVRDNGTVYVMLREPADGGGVVALRDTTGDHRADVEERFGDFGGTGIRIHGDYLYASSNTAVYRWRFQGDELVPAGERETVVSGFPEQRQHASKSFAISGAGDLFVNIGAPSNNCMEQTRTAGSPGQDPCPELLDGAGIWRFDANQTGQEYSRDARFATGIRNVVGLDINPVDGQLYVVQHGRDQLDQFWPAHYDAEDNARLPSEEYLRVNEGEDYGWPYCYHDPMQNRRVLSPEYGGNGQEVGRCDQYPNPLFAFPAHWAPQEVLFYTGDQFPARYRDGVFVAWHGSWNRAPEPQRGYKVTFLPSQNGQPGDGFEEFADGFAHVEGEIGSPGDARWRPMGLAQARDGALYIADSKQGRIWRVVHVGD